jgi:hypothetical protein
VKRHHFCFEKRTAGEDFTAQARCEAYELGLAWVHFNALDGEWDRGSALD